MLLLFELSFRPVLDILANSCRGDKNRLVAALLEEIPTTALISGSGGDGHRPVWRPDAHLKFITSGILRLGATVRMN
jgi:hypothetical protein